MRYERRRHGLLVDARELRAVVRLVAGHRVPVGAHRHLPAVPLYLRHVGDHAGALDRHAASVERLQHLGLRAEDRRALPDLPCDLADLAERAVLARLPRRAGKDVVLVAADAAAGHAVGKHVHVRERVRRRIGQGGGRLDAPALPLRDHLGVLGAARVGHDVQEARAVVQARVQGHVGGDRAPCELEARRARVDLDRPHDDLGGRAAHPPVQGCGSGEPAGSRVQGHGGAGKLGRARPARGPVQRQGVVGLPVDRPHGLPGALLPGGQLVQDHHPDGPARRVRQRPVEYAPLARRDEHCDLRAVAPHAGVVPRVERLRKVELFGRRAGGGRVGLCRQGGRGGGGGEQDRGNGGHNDGLFHVGRPASKP